MVHRLPVKRISAGHVYIVHYFNHWYLIIENKLYCVLQKYGFCFHQIGDAVDYYGRRTPYLGIIEEMERKLFDEKPEVLSLMLRGLETEYHPTFQ